MLNNEKIVLMTKLAIYEQGEGKNTLPMGKYYKSDYIGMKLLTSFVYINVAIFIVLATWIVINEEMLLTKLTEGTYMPLVKQFVIIYAATVLVYILISYVFYTYRFKTTRRSLKMYNSGLKELHRLQEKELEAVTEVEIRLDEKNLEGELKQ